MLQIGHKAPDFSLKNQYGEVVHLQSFIGQKNIVLYFYPKDETGGCTKEACSFRDSYQDFQDLGCEVIGVSSDSVESHSSFMAHHRLPFILLSDPGKSVAKLYNVNPTLFGLISGRVTYVIDKNGVIVHAFQSLMRFEKHVSESLNIIRSLNETVS